MTDVVYASNNSGGTWWLTDEDWKALEEAGWKVHWEDERFLGTLAMSAAKENTTLREAIEEWESITNQSAYAVGCDCCGSPHSFYSN